MSNKDSAQEKQELQLLEEGAAKFYLYKKDIGTLPTKAMKVFYNPKMEINRYVSNLAINTYKKVYSQEKLYIINTMAASGISALRMLLECQGIKKMIINDINPKAVELINKNLELNNLPKQDQNIIVSRKDSNFLCNELAHKKLTASKPNYKIPNIISIDPFGTPNIYLDSAFKAISKNEGLLCITATDTAVLFGVKPKACLRKYMSKPLHNDYCKETGTRILLHLISRLANINDIGIKPLFTFYSNHFIRTFILTFSQKKEISKEIKNYGYIINCKHCGHRFITQKNILDTPKRCQLCGELLDEYAGPLWIGKLHNESFLESLISLNMNSTLNINKKVEKNLQFCREECGMQISYYNIHKLCQELRKASVPKMDTLLNCIKDQGYNASRTNFDYTSIKTDMNIKELKNLMLSI